MHQEMPLTQSSQNILTQRVNSAKGSLQIILKLHPVMKSTLIETSWCWQTQRLQSCHLGLSTAAGLLLVISASVSHDLIKKTFATNITEKKELLYARFSVLIAVIIAGLFGIYPPGFVAQVVAFAFGLAAATLFPALLLGIFTKKINKEGAISGMLAGLLFTLAYIVYFKFMHPELNSSSNWLWGISPEGIGTIGMLINISVSLIVSLVTRKTPDEIRDLVDQIRQP